MTTKGDIEEIILILQLNERGHQQIREILARLKDTIEADEHKKEQW